VKDPQAHSALLLPQVSLIFLRVRVRSDFMVWADGASALKTEGAAMAELGSQAVVLGAGIAVRTDGNPRQDCRDA